MDLRRGLGSLPAAFLAVTLLFPSWIFAASSPPLFTEVWHREVIQGDLQGAAAEYQLIYEDLGAGASRPAQDMAVRTKAAFRAGACFEKLGDSRRAQSAYAWLARNAPPGDRLSRLARLRLLDVAGASAPAQAAEGRHALSTPAEAAPAAVPVREAAAVPVREAPAGPLRAAPAGPGEGARGLDALPALERLQLRVEKREAALADLRGEVRRLAADAAREERLVRRLQDLGVEVRFEEGTSAPRAAAAVVPEGSLEPDDRQRLQEVLAERFHLRGLRALVERDPARAAEDLRKAQAMKPDHPDVPDLLRSAEGYLEPMRGTSERAALRLRERQDGEARKVELALRQTLDAAALRTAPGRPAAAPPTGEAERARALEDWAPAWIRWSEGVREAAGETDLLVLLEGGQAPPRPAQGSADVVRRYAELRGEARKAAAALLETAEELVDIRSREGRRAFLLTPAAPAGPTGRSAKAVGIAAEIERLLVLGQDAYARDPSEAGPEGWRRHFLDVLTLTQWFAESDSDQRYRKLAQEYLAR